MTASFSLSDAIDQLIAEEAIAALPAWTGAPLGFTSRYYSAADLDAAAERRDKINATKPWTERIRHGWTADYCGVKSGRDIDKFSLPAITAIAASEVSAPMIEESPINIECRVDRILRLGTHDMFLSKIIAVNADEKLIDSNGRLHLEKARLVATSHGKYFSLGKQLGTFGYSVKKKNKK